jgi:putative membrane protein
MSPLRDQGLAGGLMMIEGSIVTIALFGWLFMRAAGQSERSQRLVEYAAAHGVELSPERAARAVAAGREQELRARLGGARDRAGH